MRRALHLLLKASLFAAVGGCVVPDVDLEGRPCPCAAGWICDEATRVCVRPGDAGPGDAGSDSAPADGGPDTAPADGGPDTAPADGGPDTAPVDSAGVDACTLTTVTEEWGDRPGSDHPGTILDTWINLNTDRHATDDALLLYTWPAAQVANAIVIEWDLSAIPTTATITEATVHLAQWQAVGPDYQTTAHRIEGCDPDIAADAVDGYQCNDADNWTPNTCCARGVPMGQADIAEPDDTRVLDTADGDKSWTVTDMVRTWVADPTTNLGMMINSDPTAAADDRRSFRSTEFAIASERPRLVITYGSCD